MTVGNYIEKLDSIRKNLTEIEDDLNQARQEKEYCEKKTQDILHEIELVPHTYHEIAHLSQDLAEIRRRRRIAKDIIEMTEPIVEWKNNEKVTWNRLDATIGKVRSIEEKLQHRVYYKRADNVGEIIGMEGDVEND